MKTTILTSLLALTLSTLAHADPMSASLIGDAVLFGGTSAAGPVVDHIDRNAEIVNVCSRLSASEAAQIKNNAAQIAAYLQTPQAGISPELAELDYTIATMRGLNPATASVKDNLEFAAACLGQ
jgi:hypothetical protein